VTVSQKQRVRKETRLGMATIYGIMIKSVGIIGTNDATSRR